MNLHLLNQNLTNTIDQLQHRRRGSTVLLVLAMLSILLLLGIAFSYSTRLESQASLNYAELAQARTAAATGLPMALPMLMKASQGLTTTLQDWNTIPEVLQKMVKANGQTAELTTREMAALRQAGMHVRQSKDGELERAPQASVVIRDLSGLVNLNTVEDQVAMERLVSAVLPGSDSQRKATALMALRGDLPAQVNQRRTGTNYETEAKDQDPRDGTDDVIIDNLARLNYGAAKGQPLFTDAEIKKLATMVTVYSQAPEIYNLPNNQHLPRIPLDAIAPKLVYDQLKKAFPGKKNELLLQFAANVADYSDEDDQPTILDTAGNVVVSESIDGAATPAAASAANQTIGVEMVPMVSEVYPDAATSVGFNDAGQFIEISNPWNKAVSLSGWTLRISNGRTVSLSSQLPARGYLVITDNYNTPQADVPAGHGSLVSIFGATADGSSRQVMVQPGINIPDRNATISLHDSTGQLIDTFKYSASAQVDSKQSYQRTDPVVRGSSVAEATPFQPASGGITNAEVMAAATKAWEEGNTTMTKISQLFGISTGFVESSLDATGGTGLVHAGQLAHLKVPEDAGTANSATTANTDPLPNNLDLRLIDIFTATPLPESEPDFDEEDDNLDNRQDAYQAFREKLQRMRERQQAATNDQTDDEQTTVPTVFSYGKLNLNTCSKYALLALDINSLIAKGGIADLIEQFEGYRLRQVQQGHAPFANVSEFVKEFIPNLTRSNVELLDTITDQVAVGTSAFEIVSTNRLSQKDQEALEAKDNTSGPRPATATAKWTISTDQEPYSVVSFTIIP